MQFAIYLVFILLLILLSKLVPKIDKVLAIFIGMVIFSFAAFRVGGNDYEDYILMIKTLQVINEDSFMAILSFAKDPLVGIVVRIGGLYNNDEVFIFSILIFLAVIAKIFFAFSFHHKSSLFLGLYGILLAPGLEFAAVRTSVGLGFLALFIKFYWSNFQKYTYALLAILSHVSLAPAVILPIFVKINNFIPIIILFFIVMFFTFFTVDFAANLFIERTSGYIDTKATLLSPLFPLITLVIFIFSFYKIKVSDQYIYQTAILLIAIALGSVMIMPVMGLRVLEIAWFLMLILFFQNFYSYQSYKHYIAFALFVLFLVAINLYRGTWSVFSEMNLSFL